MLIGEFADNVIERLDYGTRDNTKPDRRNLINEADSIRSEALAFGKYNATKVQESWQFNIGEDLKSLPDYLFTSKIIPILWDNTRNMCYSVMPTQWVKFKNDNGIRTIHPQRTNSQLGDGEYTHRVDFVALKAAESVRWANLESAQLAGAQGYSLEFMSTTNGLIYYPGMPQGQTGLNLLITYLIALSGLLEDDVLPMTDEFAEWLRDQCVLKFTPQKMFTRDKIESQ